MMFRRNVNRVMEVAPVLRQLMMPAAFTAYALALWRLGADMQWTNDFFIGKGMLSRWQVWLALAIATQVAASRLGKIGRGDGTDRPAAGA